MTPSGLARRLGVGDAVFIGLGAMVGAGVFGVFAPAARVAGAWLLVGLGVAAVVAYSNATSSAQLAAVYPTSGGTYIYGRERLGAWWGYVAGWGFVVGKTASCAAMALTLAAYLAPSGWHRPVAVAAVAAMTTLTCFGITRTARATRILVTVVLTVLLVSVVALWTSGGVDVGRLMGGSAGHGPYGVLQSAGLMFFAYAGYARIATLGEEVRDPRQVIPRAILVALAIAVAVYASVAVTVLVTLGPDRLAASTAPLADAVRAGSASWATPLVRLGAVTASAGALLGLLAGVGRTTLAMARHADLPSALSLVHPVQQVPLRAQLAVGVAVCVLVTTIDLRGAIAFSSFGVLVYYLIANVAAWTQDAGDRRYPRAVQAAGVIGCATLVVTLPLAGIVSGVVVFAIGVAARLVTVRRRLSAG